MKQTLLRRRLPLLVTGIALSVAIISGKMQDSPPAPGFGTLNFETDPPIPLRMTLQQTDNGGISETPSNIRFRAMFGKEAVGDVKFLQVFLTSITTGKREAVILHDDGLDGDDRAGDLVFTAGLEENIDLFRQSVSNAESKLKSGGSQILSFDGRSATVETKQTLFDLASFDAFKEVTIDGSIFKIKPDIGIDPCDLPIDRFKSLFVTDISVTEDPVRTFNPCTGVGNPNGAWTYKTLMTNMANFAVTGITVDSLTREWLDTWMKGTPRLTPGTTNPTVNTQVLDSRVHPNTPVTTQATTILHTVIKPWLRCASGNPNQVIDSLPTSANYWKFLWRRMVAKGVDVMACAPFKLTAIVNRVDLRGNGGYAGSLSNAGEGRFVYSIIKDPKSNCGNAVSSLTQPFVGFNIIFEYGIPINDQCELFNYQQKWRSLSDLAFGAAFNTALEPITNVFTGVNAAPGKTNGSALNQLRSDEIANSSLLTGGAPFWQMREFVLPEAKLNKSLLRNTTTKLEPMFKFNGAPLNPLNAANTLADVTTLANFINSNTAAIEANNYTVPDIAPASGGGTINFQAGRADVHSPSATSTTHHWNGRGVAGNASFVISDSARHNFSLNTCSGCHGGETRTAFTHVRYTAFGHNITPTSISGGVRDISSFITGLGPDAISTDNDADPNGLFFVSDPAARPAGSPRIRGFNDLLRREQSMRTLLCNGCGGRRGVVFDLVDVMTFKPASKTH